MTKRAAQAFINSLKILRNIVTDEQAVNAIAIYPEWRININYDANDRVVYNNILYKVLINHVSQEDWTPEIATSLFAKVLIPNTNIVPNWEQPNSTNPYAKGDKVMHNDMTWISIIDNNVWEPGVYGWETV